MKTPDQPTNRTLPEPLTYTVVETAAAIGCKPATVYRLIARRVLRPVRGLRHKLIPRRQVADLCLKDEDQ